MTSCPSTCICPVTRLSLDRINNIMRNPIPQAVCIPQCPPVNSVKPVVKPAWNWNPSKIVNVNVNLNVNKSENTDLGVPVNGAQTELSSAELAQRIRDAVNNALED